jgi:predicted transposase YdaD
MPPYIIECADKRSVVFDYDVIQLWEVETAWIVQRHLIPLYVLLPGTKAPTVDLMKKALHEMFQVYDRHELGYRFGWFYKILRRTDTVLEEEKQIIEKELRVQFNYQELIEDDPVIQNLLAERELRGEAEGEARGLQKSILNFLQARFPALAATPQARQAVASIQDLEKLDLLQQALYIASDEQTARRFLKLPAQEDLI